MKFKEIIKNLPDEKQSELKTWKRKWDRIDLIYYGCIVGISMAILGLTLSGNICK